MEKSRCFQRCPYSWTSTMISHGKHGEDWRVQMCLLELDDFPSVGYSCRQSRLQKKPTCLAGLPAVHLAAPLAVPAAAPAVVSASDAVDLAHEEQICWHRCFPSAISALTLPCQRLSPSAVAEFEVLLVKIDCCSLLDVDAVVDLGRPVLCHVLALGRRVHPDLVDEPSGRGSLRIHHPRRLLVESYVGLGGERRCEINKYEQE
mmetsp:Transcript_28565/g.60287  ORF Transcript_28565/g.60287 Transcript_28565/m.60287 type:complete len:204 (-) Transcript_28565:13-624(-)